MSLRFTCPFAMTGLIALLGCGDDGAATDAGFDGSADGGDGAAALPVTPPNIPWLADGVPPLELAPCPDGWREVSSGAVVACDPYPEGGAEACEDGEAHFLGEPGCRPIGDACPTGDYAASLPSTGPVLYVNAGALAGGDGTLGAPFRAIGEVPWASLTASTTVALGKGTYPGTVALKAGVAMVGACAGETIVTGMAAPVQSVVSVTTAGEPAVVENLTIRGAPQFGALAERGRALRLRGVLIDGVTGFGVIGFGAGTNVSLSDVVIRGTEPSASNPYDIGMGIHMQEGARLDASRIIVAGNRYLGISAAGEDVVLTIDDVVVRDTLPHEADRRSGRGLEAGLGARIDATRLLVSGNHDIGVVAAGAGSVVTMTDAVVRDTKPNARSALHGRGLEVTAGAEISATRLLVTGNRDVGVFVGQPGSRAVLTDAVIRDTTPEVSGASKGRGIGVQEGAHFDGTRVAIVGNAGLGTYVSGAGSAMSLTDALIHNTTSGGAITEVGRGVSVQYGARFEASQLLVTEAGEFGVLATGDGTVVDLSDVVIRDTRSHGEDRRFGRGLQGQEGARIDGARLELERSLELGVLALRGASVTLTDTTVRTVATAGCAATDVCPNHSLGYGVVAVEGSLSMTRFLVTGSAICGVMVAAPDGSADASALDLEAGEVSHSAIGACVQIDGYDVDRLTTEVRYTDNTLNLEATMLAVPGVADPL